MNTAFEKLKSYIIETTGCGPNITDDEIVIYIKNVIQTAANDSSHGEEGEYCSDQAATAASQAVINFIRNC